MIWVKHEDLKAQMTKLINLVTKLEMPHIRVIIFGRSDENEMEGHNNANGQTETLKWRWDIEVLKKAKKSIDSGDFKK